MVNRLICKLFIMKLLLLTVFAYCAAARRQKRSALCTIFIHGLTGWPTSKTFSGQCDAIRTKVAPA